MSDTPDQTEHPPRVPPPDPPGDERVPRKSGEPSCGRERGDETATEDVSPGDDYQQA
jgi:hypothetical protein